MGVAHQQYEGGDRMRIIPVNLATLVSQSGGRVSRGETTVLRFSKTGLPPFGHKSVALNAALKKRK